MPRPLTAMLLLPALGVGSGIGGSAGHVGKCLRGVGGESIDCGGGYVVPSARPAPHQRPRPQGKPVPPPPPGAGPASAAIRSCLEVKLTSFEGPPADGTVQVAASLQAWLTCPPFPIPAAPAGAPAAARPTPATTAVQFWRTIPLPVPRPTVPPGYAVTGEAAYLVTGGSLHPAPYHFDTPLGELTVTAAGTYRVDWGDGPRNTWSGPYSSEGRPWPDGAVSHVYDVAGRYDVTLEEDWTATWVLAGATGRLTGLHTTATIPRFRVEQLQAVIGY